MIAPAHHRRILYYLLSSLLPLGACCYASAWPLAFDAEGGSAGTGTSDQTASVWVGTTGFHAATSAQLGRKAYLSLATSQHILGREKFLYVVAIWPIGKTDDKAVRGLNMDVSGSAKTIQHIILSKKSDLEIQVKYSSGNGDEHLTLEGNKYSLSKGRVFLVRADDNGVEVKQQVTPKKDARQKLDAGRYSRAWEILDRIATPSRKSTREDSVAPCPSRKADVSVAPVSLE